MAGLSDDDMEAINRYFMQQVKVKTPAAEKIKQEWMRWWETNKRGWTSYTVEESDLVRNMKHRFDMANATSAAEREHVENVIANGLTAEELQGETKRAGTTGMFLEEEKPLIPTSWKVAAGIGAGLLVAGVFAKKLLAFTPLGKLTKFLP